VDSVKTPESTQEQDEARANRISDKSEAVRKAAARLIPGIIPAETQERTRGSSTSRTCAAFADPVVVPPVISKGKGATLTDVDGNDYIDYVCANGALILGHADERIVAAVHKAASKSWGFPSLTQTAVRLAELIAGRFPAVDMVRLVNSPTEALCGAMSLACTSTGRSRHILVMGGCEADREGVRGAAGDGRDTFLIPHNDRQAAETVFNEHGSSIAALVVDPMACGLGLAVPAEDYISALRRLCDKHGALLVFDESVTGLRLAPGGAKHLFEVRADLTCLGPILGGGLPLAAYGGRKDLMMMLASGPDTETPTGASSANALAIAAGVAVLEAMGEPDFYEELEAKSARLEEGLCGSAAQVGIQLASRRMGSLLGLSLEPRRPRGKTRRSHCDFKTWRQFSTLMLERGVFLPPTPAACLFVSAAHTTDHIDGTIELAHDVLRKLSADSET
jgi:glutamate-1-semialdehyde 2,1-aminomutase